MRGNWLSVGSLSTCDPILYTHDLGVNGPVTAIDDKTTLGDGDLLYPCGLIGKFLFNDTYKLYKINGTLKE